MSRKCNRFLAFLLTLALVTTTFSSDYASTRSFAVGSEEELEQISEDSDEESSELQWEDIETDEETPAESEENESDIEADVETETEVSEETPSDQATEGAVEEATADITNGGNVVEEPATAPAATEATAEATTEATASATEAVEASSEATSANVESIEAASAATSASIEEAADAASSASTEIEEKEQNLVTVKYKASMGGRVSVKEETVDLNDKDAKFEGSEATPWNDKYQFTEWVDEDGNFVTNDPLLVPSDVEKDTTFTAKFMKLEEMPEIKEQVTTGGMNVSVKADEGLFPEGTTVSIEAISDDKAMETAQDTLGDNVKEAKGVDIKFIYEEKEIQPADAQYVHVSISLVETIEGTDFTVLHEHDGEVKEIEDADISTEEKNSDPADDTQVATAVEFDSNEFSIYIVVGQETQDNDARLNVKFMNGETEIASVFVKKNDLEDGADGNHFNEIIYDPGVGELDPGVQFRGWTQTEDYTIDTPELDIDGVRAEITDMLNAGVKEGDSVTYYAMLFKTYTVSYLDDRGASLGSSEIKFRADDAAQYHDYHVFMNYTASDENHNFEGWHVSEGKDNIEDYDYSANDGEGKLYANGADIKIKGDVTFSAIEAEGHWLVFNENGKGATYNAPQFVKSGKPTVEPCKPEEMIRLGYTFGGWYDTEAHANAHAQNTNVTTGKFTFGSTISEKTTIYASWISATTANYTILLWRQNIDGESYDFAKAITLSGTVGSTINAVTVRGTGNNAYVKIGNTNYNGDDYKGFHYVSNDQSGKTIVPEGTTVVNVYYNRNEHTLKFQVYKSFLIWGGWSTVKEITALYGQSISDQFPIVGTDGTEYNAARWLDENYSNNNATYKYVLSYIDIMPDADVTFLQDTDGPGTFRTINYYVEALPGDEVVKTYDNMSFVLYKSLDCDYRRFTEAEDYIRLPGFTNYKYYPDNAWNYPNGPTTVDCYYTRNKYSINYMDGSYFDGNGNRIDTEENVGRIHQESNILYQADVSTINYEPSPTHAGYVFECWCVDSACTTEYTFGTMPEGGITVYAKWRQIQYRVFLHPNAGTDSTLDWGSDDQEMNFRISYGGKVSVPTGKRTTGYEFRGWYLDPEFKNGFDAESFVLNETTVTDDSYDKTVDFTDPMDKWGNFKEGEPKSNSDVDRFWITKKLDLYAKWRGTLDGATGIGIIYDANGGSPAPSDTNLYGDQSWAAAGAAPTTTPAITEGEGENAKTYESRFSHWVVQKWNDTTKKFEDTNVTVLPGATFQVIKDDARVQDLDEEHSSETEKKSYTIQLRAEYVKVERSTPTHITWYKNYEDGSDGIYRYDDKVEVNIPVTVYGLGNGESIPSRTGYIFKGWARDEESVGKTTTNTSPLFITYDPSVYSDNKGYNHAQVAADEKEPYHALYAVWEENPNATYTVTYVAEPATMGDVTTTENKDIQVLSTTGVTGSAATAKAGYKFTGWYNGTTLASEDAELTAEEAIEKLNKDGNVYLNTTFTAKFEVDAGQTYTVSYESNDTKMGTVTNAKDEGIQVLGTEGITGSTAQPKAGYKFEGWYLVDGETETKLEEAGAVLTHDVLKPYLKKNETTGIYEDTKFRAKFAEKEDETYTVTYEAGANGKVDPTSQTEQVLHDEKITGSEATANVGYKFEGWYLVDGETETKLEGAGAVLTHDVLKPYLKKNETTGIYENTTFKAKFEYDDSKKYDVTYERNISEAGSLSYYENKDIQALQSDKVTGSVATVNAGYKFNGWYKKDETTPITTELDLTKVLAIQNLNRNADHNELYDDTIYVAEFAEKEDETYTVTYEAGANGKVDPTSQTEQVLHDEKITGSTATANAGYKFEGWYLVDGETETKLEGAGAVLTHDVLKPYLKKNETTGIYEDTTFEARFVVDESKTYKAKYVSANTAYGTVNPDEDAEASQVLGTANVKGSTATAKTGYKFTGWYVGNDKVGDDAVLTEAVAKANITMEGNIYKETTFTAHFDVDEDQKKTLSYTVQHSVAGTVQTADTQEYKTTVWVNDPDTIEVKTGSLAKKEYTGYKYDSQDPAEVTEGSLVNDGRVITLNYVRDDAVTKTVVYVVQYEIDGVVDANNSKAYPKEVWVNDPDTITVEAGSLEQKTFEGYKFIGQNPANIKEGDEVKNETVITLRYQKDEDQTKDVAYTVNHVVDGTVRDTANYPAKVWVNDPSEIEVTKDSLAAKDYVGYEVQDIEVVGSDVVISEDVVSKVTDGTVINLIYGPRTYTVRYEYRFATDDRPDTLPALPASFEVKYGQEFDVIDVPTIEGYTLTFWSMEEDKENTSVISKMIDAFQKFLDIITGKIKASAAGTTMKAPAYNAVIYTVISANPAPTPTPDPTPTGGDDPTPAGGDDPTPAAPTPVTPAPVAAGPAPAPAAAVLGATREGTAATNGAAVLGSRRAKTDDQTDDTSRAFAIVIAAAVAISLFVTRKKKEEE